MTSTTNPLNWNSSSLTSGWQRGINAFYWGLGFSPEDFEKAQVGIGTPLLEGNLCNVHAYELATLIREGCAEAGLIGFPFGVSPVSDNITQGHEGGSASLPSRNHIANGTELVCTSHCYDAIVGLHHCDKNGPGFAMALARTNYPGLIVNGGSILPGCHRGRDTTILDVYDAAAKAANGTMDYEESEEIIRTACPGPGGCGIAASFNTWGIAMEAIGLSLPDTSSRPAVAEEKREECRRVGAALRHLLERGIRPRDILTREAFVNATTTLAAIGGSTNGILHVLALAREAGVDFTLRDIQAICRKTPVLCNFAPRGTGTMHDLHELGGTSMLLRHLLDGGFLKGDCLTVTGNTLAENLADASPVPKDQSLVAPLDAPFKSYADIQICFGNVAPDGVVFKVSSLDEPSFAGTAICFDDSREVHEAAAAGRIKPGHVVIMRRSGPVAAGMPEVHVASAALAVPELKGKVALLSDTRVSGVSSGAVGVHCAPEAAVGGPIAAVRDGDPVTFDLLAGSIHVEADLDAAERREEIPESRHRRGYLADFAATVTQANEGCVSRWVISP
ncbi:MAG: dihydroxy-acid dehydratase [Verrucomicrobiales bacterium]